MPPMTSVCSNFNLTAERKVPYMLFYLILGLQVTTGREKKQIKPVDFTSDSVNFIIRLYREYIIQKQSTNGWIYSIKYSYPGGDSL